MTPIPYVRTPGWEALVAQAINENIVTTGSDLFQQVETGAVVRTQIDKLRDIVNVRDFGAVGDGSTDDSTAFQDALNTNKTVMIPHSDAGYVVNGLVLASDMALVADKPVRIIADDTFATLGTAAANDIVANVTIRNLNIDMRGAVDSASAAFIFQAAAGGNRQWNVRISDVNVIGAYCTVKQASDLANCYLFQTYFERVNSYFPRGTSWNLPNVQGFVLLRFCQVDWTGDSVVTAPMLNGATAATAFAPGYPAFQIGGLAARSAGIQLEWCAVSSNQVHDDSAGHAFVIRNITAPTLSNCEADGITGVGFKIGDSAYASANVELLSVSQLVMEGCVAFYHGEDGFRFDKVVSCQIDAMRAVGRKGAASGSATQIGVKISNSTDITQDGTVILSQRGDGFYCADSFIITGSTMRVRDCGDKAARLTNVVGCSMPMNLKLCADGLYITGTSTDNVISGLVSRSHTGAGVTFDGAGVTRNTVIGVSLISNGTYGRKDLNACNYNVVSGGSFAGNATGNILQVGAGSATANYVNNAGTFVASSVGAGAF